MINTVFVNNQIANLLRKMLDKNDKNIDFSKIEVVDKITKQVRKVDMMPAGEYMIIAKHQKLPIREHICNLKITRNDEKGDFNCIVSHPKNLVGFIDSGPKQVKQPIIPKGDENPKFDRESLSNIKYHKLKSLAKSIGVSASGTKEEVIARIIAK